MKEHLIKIDNEWVVKPDSLLYQTAISIFYKCWGIQKKINFFPGPQPISIERKHFPILISNEYVVCEKTDGTRNTLLCFLFDTKKVNLMINRALQMKFVSITLSNEYYQGSLLDGELIENTFLLYDVMWIKGEDVKSFDFNQRLEILKQFTKGITKLSKDKITIKTKNFLNLKGIKQFEYSEYPNDGLIFTPVKEPIKLGTHETMFKWKPQEKNTVDFQVKWRHNGKWGLFVQERGNLIFESEIPTDKLDVNWLVEDSIVECKYMIHDTPLWWKPICVRKDKTYPNNRRTFYNTIVNIQENIQIDEFTRLYKTK